MLPEITSSDLTWIIPILLWDIAWKGLALWRSAKNNQPVWFVLILLINSAGVLPIVYLVFFQSHRKKSD